MTDDHEDAYTWASEKDRKRDLRRMKINGIKYGIGRWWHGFYWNVLHITRLARPYSIVTCKMNLYAKYSDGRCHWCGKYH